MRTNKVLYRDTKNGKIAGVCSGLAEYMDVDVSLIRIVWLFFVIFGGAGLLLYLIAALVIPAKSGDDVDIIVEDEEQKRLTRDSENAVIFGVCSGIAKHFGMDVSVVRIIFLLMGLYFASGIFLYIILALVLPKN
ncbi:MAG: PspC domain-containing protein [Candidatus Cloacimonetes bacterium]|nr:PspC domain-containing protein [Candidatus Cloacimonadota bacterium]